MEPTCTNTSGVYGNAKRRSLFKAIRLYELIYGAVLDTHFSILVLKFIT